MRMFDALILNTDRHQGNWLWTVDWQMYLIDHSRSFRMSRKLPREFVDSPVRLTRPVYDRLEGLDTAALSAALGEVLDKARIKAVLKRREAILKRVEQEREKVGDLNVFR